MSKEKKIEELRRFLATVDGQGIFIMGYIPLAEALHNEGYRKQSEGEWEYEQLDNFRKYKVTCPFCKSYYIGNYDAYDDPEYFNFCPECGAKMKGV